MTRTDGLGLPNGTLPPQPQGLQGYSTNEEWQDLVAQAAAMTAALDDIPDGEIRDRVFGALAGIDAVHREALHRLVRLFKDGVLEQVITDPAIKTLMGMYDLLPPEQPGCQKVWDFLDEPEPSGPADSVVPVPGRELAHWSPAPVEVPLTDGDAFLLAMEEGPFILVRAEQYLYAFSAICPVHGKSMAGGRLQSLMWLCPHAPGCAYDIRNGARLGGGAALDCRPVKIDTAGRVLLGFGMSFEPAMPAF
jgi:nitrite reductase/ring-hydroxylating ferredoxin subunit